MINKNKQLVAVSYVLKMNIFFTVSPKESFFFLVFILQLFKIFKFFLTNPAYEKLFLSRRLVNSYKL